MCQERGLKCLRTKVAALPGGLFSMQVRGDGNDAALTSRATARRPVCKCGLGMGMAEPEVLF